DQAERTPQAVALIQDKLQLSYAELNARANRLAAFLREMGVGPDTRVALCLERGPEMVLALLAVLKAGGAYVPLDPGYPAQRLGFMLRDSAPRLLLAETGTIPGLAGVADAVPVIDLRADADRWSSKPAHNPQAPRMGLKPTHLAYVIYTSGSTGTPKGVMVEHQGACNLVAAQTRGLGVEPSSRILQFASFSF